MYRKPRSSSRTSTSASGTRITGSRRSPSPPPPPIGPSAAPAVVVAGSSRPAQLPVGCCLHCSSALKYSHCAASTTRCAGTRRTAKGGEPVAPSPAGRLAGPPQTPALGKALIPLPLLLQRPPLAVSPRHAATVLVPIRSGTARNTSLKLLPTSSLSSFLPGPMMEGGPASGEKHPAATVDGTDDASCSCHSASRCSIASSGTCATTSHDSVAASAAVNLFSGVSGDCAPERHSPPKNEDASPSWRESPGDVGGCQHAMTPSASGSSSSCHRARGSRRPSRGPSGGRPCPSSGSRPRSRQAAGPSPSPRASRARAARPPAAAAPGPTRPPPTGRSHRPVYAWSRRSCREAGSIGPDSASCSLSARPPTSTPNT